MTRLAAALVLLTLAGPAAAQAPGRLPYGGSEVFRFALYTKELQPVTANDRWAAFNDPMSSILIVLGDTARLSQYITPVQLRNFVTQGGAVLIATDSETPLFDPNGQAGWGLAFGVHVTGNHLEAANPKNGYQGVAGRPFVRPRPAGAKLFDDLPGGRVATDRPSDMSAREPNGFIMGNLAGYPDGTRRIGDGQRVDPAENYFAISRQPRNGGPGRALVVADQSVFVNGMMGFKPTGGGDYELDNGNWEFAKRTIDWLKDGRQPRTRCLFIEDGRVIDKFAVELPQTKKPPLPDIPPDKLANVLLNHSNGLLNELQEKNYFNRVLEGWLGFPRLLRMFLVVVTVLFLLAGLRWLIRGHRKLEPAATLSPAVQAALLPRGGVVRQRTAAQLQVGNLYEAARRRVRERFDVLGGRPGADGRMPALMTANDLADTPLLRQTVRWLWGVGYGETPVAVAPADWDRLNGLLERVTARAARGDWSFGQAVG